MINFRQTSTVLLGLAAFACAGQPAADFNSSVDEALTSSDPSALTRRIAEDRNPCDAIDRAQAALQDALRRRNISGDDRRAQAVLRAFAGLRDVFECDGRVDAGTTDGGTSDAGPAPGTRCRADSDCARGEVCLFEPTTRTGMCVPHTDPPPPPACDDVWSFILSGNVSGIEACVIAGRNSCEQARTFEAQLARPPQFIRDPGEDFRRNLEAARSLLQGLIARVCGTQPPVDRCDDVWAFIWEPNVEAVSTCVRQSRNPCETVHTYQRQIDALAPTVRLTAEGQRALQAVRELLLRLESTLCNVMPPPSSDCRSALVAAYSVVRDENAFARALTGISACISDCDTAYRAQRINPSVAAEFGLLPADLPHPSTPFARVNAAIYTEITALCSVMNPPVTTCRADTECGINEHCVSGYCMLPDRGRP